ncbi:unnamed protein product [Brugia timori]|uniref:Transmembrane protein n=1 Tax=Brugia timori TaxID=42155 RepID=A0A0R3Q5N6_9BILA|nr:unnamed protein product [Brugia timori]
MNFLCSFSRDFEKLRVELTVQPLVSHLDHSPLWRSATDLSSPLNKKVERLTNMPDAFYVFVFEFSHYIIMALTTNLLQYSAQETVRIIQISGNILRADLTLSIVPAQHSYYHKLFRSSPKKVLIYVLIMMRCGGKGDCETLGSIVYGFASQVYSGPE